LVFLDVRAGVAVEVACGVVDPDDETVEGLPIIVHEVIVGVLGWEDDAEELSFGDLHGVGTGGILHGGEGHAVGPADGGVGEGDDGAGGAAGDWESD
jgi:hypothetical protein